MKKLRVPVPGANPAAKIVKDTIAHYKITQTKVAKALKVKPSYLSEIINGKRGLSTEFAIKFAICFDMNPEFLIKLQARHDYLCTYHKNNFEETVEPLELAAS